MTSRATHDVEALELGFLADGILQAVNALAKGGANGRHYSWLQQGVDLLSGLAAGVGPAPSKSEPQLQFASLASFPFAAEALRAVPNPTVSDGLRSYFGMLADTLKRLIQGVDVAAQEIDRVCEFFRGIAEATLDSWSPARNPTLLGPERLPWTMS
jgi:hypothetical protein